MRLDPQQGPLIQYIRSAAPPGFAQRTHEPPFFAGADKDEPRPQLLGLFIEPFVANIRKKPGSEILQNRSRQSVPPKPADTFIFARDKNFCFTGTFRAKSQRP